MKKQLLLGSALLATLSAFPQTGRVVPKGTNVQPVDMAATSNQRYIEQLHKPEPAQKAPTYGPQNQKGGTTAKSVANPTATVFQPFTGSANVFGVLESNSRPLSYNDELNLVSFIHRKSSTYRTNPVQTTTGAISGAIVSVFSDDWGGNWDSTCVWNNAAYWARYPQGGVYNPPSNTLITNAYVVASGPVTGQANSWQGSFLATKQLDTLGNGNDSTASSVSNAQQFISNTATTSVTKKFDFPSLHFSATDDGKVRAVGMYVKDYNATTSAAFGFIGANVVTGTFNNSTGTMDWAGEYIIPPVRLVPSYGYRQIVARPHMAWNESGTVGYVWFIGCDSNAVNVESSGYQPIVYKTTNSGGSWSQIPGINFQNPQFQAPVMNMLFSTAANTAITIPYFYTGEGIDGIVDANNDLHIVTTVIATARSNPDSLGYIWPAFPLGKGNDGEAYLFGHRPGFRPYIYDFHTTSSGWDVLMVDSMSSEAPGVKSADAGFNDNPWDANTDKSETDARLQMSRTTDGKNIVITWAESDTIFTNNQHKWNSFPDVKASRQSCARRRSIIASNQDRYHQQRERVRRRPRNKALCFRKMPEGVFAHLYLWCSDRTSVDSVKQHFCSNDTIQQRCPLLHFSSPQL